MKSLVTMLLITLLISPQHLRAEEQNAGFVQGLWYSVEPVFEGVSTRIYVALRNNTGHDLTSTVRFTDNDTRIGTFEVRALEGRLVEAWVDWMPTYGEHTISAIVGNAELHIVGGSSAPIDITGTTVSDTLFVDYDTDGDGTGNTDDSDDDGDEVSDDDEIARGTNPLVPNPKAEEKQTDIILHETSSTIRTHDTPITTQRKGLEQFVSAHIPHSFLSTATEKIEQTKVSLDAYRAERSTPPMLPTQDVATSTKSTESTQEASGNQDSTTITRTQLNSNTHFLSSFVSGIASLLHSLWTGVLYGISVVLSYPAPLEALFLLLLLYVLYRVARRIGRRKRF